MDADGRMDEHMDGRMDEWMNGMPDEFSSLYTMSTAFGLVPT